MTYVLAPKGVVNASGVDGKEAEGDAAQVVREPAMIGILRVAAENMIAGRHRHAYLGQ